MRGAWTALVQPCLFMDAIGRGAHSPHLSCSPPVLPTTCVACRQHGVAYCVAPYEADSQLAFLASLPEAAGGVAAGARRPCIARLPARLPRYMPPG